MFFTPIMTLQATICNKYIRKTLLDTTVTTKKDANIQLFFLFAVALHLTQGRHKTLVLTQIY